MKRMGVEALYGTVRNFVSGRAAAHCQAIALMKRSPKMTGT
jgi:hypothetical protein